ncbi:MAG: N-acetyltransferase [Pseudomonadales bacterium]|nr:N-acetyltransferase [Pseudomonadales bacterium]
MSYTLQAFHNIRDIGPTTWNRLANPLTTQPDCGVPFDPFLSYEFLHALEISGSACPATGWAPYHLALDDESGNTAGLVPMYLKNHSQGEYVFDWGWADAFERAGGRYYPKLQIAVPFTPATGRRLLAGATADVAETEALLMSGIVQVAEQLQVSSVHITFVAEDQWQRMGKQGYLQRTHKQFHWENDGYRDFDDFLDNLSSKKRKNIRRERRDALASGIEIELLSGTDLQEHHWDAFYQFYIDTGSRKWGQPYLTREFFSHVSELMADRILLILCRRHGRYIAGTINFIGSECLFGRNWGCIEDHRFLHFEVCYYQAIEYAIRHGLKRVEAGAQGPHKLARGYLPRQTYSTHWVVNQSFREAVAHFLEDETLQIQDEIEYLNEHSPFRRD